MDFSLDLAEIASTIKFKDVFSDELQAYLDLLWLDF